MHSKLTALILIAANLLFAQAAMAQPAGTKCMAVNIDRTFVSNAGKGMVVLRLDSNCDITFKSVSVHCVWLRFGKAVSVADTVFTLVVPHERQWEEGVSDSNSGGAGFDAVTCQVQNAWE
jgi:hypothetical protein